MKNNYFLVTFQDGLQGKTHKTVYQAESLEDAWDTCLRKEAWQFPKVLDVQPYKHANRITD